VGALETTPSNPRFSKDVTAWEYRYTAAAIAEDKGHDTKVAHSANTAEKMAPEPMQKEAKDRQERTERMPRGNEEAGESDSTLKPGPPGLLLTLNDITRLPRHELVTQFKCIEGWSQNRFTTVSHRLVSPPTDPLALPIRPSRSSRWLIPTR